MRKKTTDTAVGYYFLNHFREIIPVYNMEVLEGKCLVILSRKNSFFFLFNHHPGSMRTRANKYFGHHYDSYYPALISDEKRI